MKAFFRIKDWWWSKAALLMGFVYLYAAWFGISFEKMVWLSLLSVSTIAGFASLGYFSNDFFGNFWIFFQIGNHFVPISNFMYVFQWQCQPTF